MKYFIFALLFSLPVFAKDNVTDLRFRLALAMAQNPGVCSDTPTEIVSMLLSTSGTSDFDLNGSIHDNWKEIKNRLRRPDYRPLRQEIRRNLILKFYTQKLIESTNGDVPAPKMAEMLSGVKFWDQDAGGSSRYSLQFLPDGKVTEKGENLNDKAKKITASYSVEKLPNTESEATGTAVYHYKITFKFTDEGKELTREYDLSYDAKHNLTPLSPETFEVNLEQIGISDDYSERFTYPYGQNPSKTDCIP